MLAVKTLGRVVPFFQPWPPKFFLAPLVFEALQNCPSLLGIITCSTVIPLLKIYYGFVVEMFTKLSHSMLLQTKSAILHIYKALTY